MVKKSPADLAFRLQDVLQQEGMLENSVVVATWKQWQAWK